MPVYLEWGCSKPSGSLGTAMGRLAREIAEEGEYYEAIILSTPKTASGGRPAAPHFKVRLIGTDDGRRVNHEHLIKIGHQNGNGSSTRYVTNRQARGARYPYDTLVATNGPPSRCPKRCRLQRESEAAAAAVGAEWQAGGSNVSGNQVGSGYSSSDHDPGSSTGTGDFSTGGYAEGWYPDPWAAQSGKAERWYTLSSRRSKSAF